MRIVNWQISWCHWFKIPQCSSPNNLKQQIGNTSQTQTINNIIHISLWVWKCKNRGSKINKQWTCEFINISLIKYEQTYNRTNANGSNIKCYGQVNIEIRIPSLRRTFQWILVIANSYQCTIWIRLPESLWNDYRLQK